MGHQKKNLLTHYELFFLLIFLSGCSSTLHLRDYEPIIKNPIVHSTVVIAVQPIDEIDSYFIAQDKQEGSVNLWKYECAEFPFWVNSALEKELTNAGYIVQDRSKSIPTVNESFYIITHGPANTENSNFTINFSVKYGEREIFSKKYFSKYKMEHKLYEIVFGLSYMINKDLTHSIQDVIPDFINDLIELGIFSLTS